MNNKARTKIVGLLIAFMISIFLAAIISFCLVKIFSRQPQEILNINVESVINNIKNEKAGMEIFVLSVLAFLLFMLVSVFKVFDLDDYLSKTYVVTPDIKIPFPVGKSQTQQGSAWWLNKKDLYKKPFGVNTFDPNNPMIHNLLEFSKKQREIEKIKMDRLEKINDLMENHKISFSEAEKQVPVPIYPENRLTNIQKEQLKSNLFKKGGICVGKRDRNVISLVKSRLFRKSSLYKIKKKKSRRYIFYKRRYA